MIKEIIQEFSLMGSSYTFGIVFLFALILQKYQLALQLFIGVVILFIIGYGIRFFWYKDRPQKEKHQTLLQKLDASSFPSLHAGRSIILGSLIGFFFNNTLIFGLLMLLILLNGYSRVYQKRHYWSDVLGGWGAGIIIILILMLFF
ncbi:phosphatase PAP2 family protein [Candidatus Woesearchaeota archaeon]|nr:phosphatase PAP2 family protein [Candidatus Woesearchaeota archaeon]MBT3304824.1 phosphatase PAP2 family protein [Candidatus Woesearchaeota archaeon]MBT4367840.1 phosphatase PAP2 family protein [Candidatus Woesearchaeota archaeon]MBT4712328.1 phosphatase PAP2 family protein [Candidatus Woesearchaeota archaeon]MBT6639240.1 phosphatase PAP2 family protein [Candidatus Woesearchaeota archaeon]